MMNEFDRRKSGRLYHPLRVQDDNFMKSNRILREIDDAWAKEEPLRPLFEKLFASFGKGASVVPPLYVDLGKNIWIGEDSFINTEFLALDEGDIVIGNHVQIGPRASFYTAIHPFDAIIRQKGVETAKGITIEDDVWLGGSVTVNPGVTIHKGAIIGSGSVVTKDIPAFCIAAGNPCRVLRYLCEEDSAECRRQYEDYAADPDITLD